MDKDRLYASIRRSEGNPTFPNGNSKLYKDTVGKWTIGVGFNLDDVGLYPEEVAFILDNRCMKIIRELDDYLSWWRGLDDVRQNVLAEMAFNMGLQRVLGFHDMLAYLKAGYYNRAAQAGSDSLWAKEVGDRAARLMLMMADGQWH